MLALTAAVLASALDNPCALLTPGDIERVIGWTVTRGVAKTYSLPGTSGTLCTFDGRDGSVVVTVTARGGGLPVNGATNGLSIGRATSSAKGLPIDTEIGPDEVLVHYRRHDYGITVQSVNAQFSDEIQLRQLATALIARLQTASR